MYYFWLLANLKEAFAVEKPRQAASSSSDKRKITKSKKYRDDSLSSPPSLPMKPIEEELNEIHAAVWSVEDLTLNDISKDEDSDMENKI
ncbi:hypothetical protein MSG28_014406 [Choristoneura fumiferana]|uniref:Uncharacterized protein n=1 Tax=Choristoneura fumiferana TaxID=7141 RepID=A0ACC0JRZ7_CHOFU|nr:hypothetical protein MSG28_014406 [Choristoneura fumiferana]